MAGGISSWAVGLRALVPHELVARGLTLFLASSHGSMQYGGWLHQASKGDGKRESMKTIQVMVFCKVIQADPEDIVHSDPEHGNKGNVSIK